MVFKIKPKLIKNFLKYGLVFAVCLIAAFSMRAILADWQEPPAAPPVCPAGEPACNTPINVSSFAQTKAGDLTIQGDIYAAGGLSTFDSSVANNTVEANQFCLDNGGNCIADWPAGGVSFWEDAGTYIYPTNVGSSFRITDGGNLGIGSNNPLQKLDVNGISLMRGSLRLNNFQTISFLGNVNPGNNWALYGSANDTVLNAPAAGQIAFKVGNSEKAKITSSGRFYVRNNDPRIYIDNTGTGNYWMMFQSSPSGDFHWNNCSGGICDWRATLKTNGDFRIDGSYLTGDIIFQKDGEELWRMFEDEEGLYAESLKTGKVYKFLLEEIEK